MSCRASSILFPILTGFLFLVGCDKPAQPSAGKPETSTPVPSPTPTPTPEDPLTNRLGFVVPLTGAQSTFGQDAAKGAELAVEEINAAGGLLDHPVKLITRDTASKPDTTARVVTELIEQDKVLALIGEIATDRSLVAAPLAQSHQIPMITPASTHEAVTMVGPFIFRVCYTDRFQALAMSEFAISIDATKAAILFDPTSPYGADLAGIFKQDFIGREGQIVAEENYRPGQPDFAEQLEKIKAANPDVVFLPSYYTEAAHIIAQARKMGLEMPFLGTDGWDSPEFLRIGGAAVNNCYFSSHFSPETKSPSVESFVAAYTAKYQNPPPPLAALAYDSVYLVAHAIKQAGKTEPIALQSALAGTKDLTCVTGSITFDEKRNPRKPTIIIRIQDQQFTYLETVESSEPHSP